MIRFQPFLQLSADPVSGLSEPTFLDGPIEALRLGLMLFPGLLLVLFGLLFLFRDDDTFSLERFYIRHYLRRDKDFNYARFQRRRGALALVLGVVWLSTIAFATFGVG